LPADLGRGLSQIGFISSGTLERCSWQAWAFCTSVDWSYPLIFLHHLSHLEHDLVLLGHAFNRTT
jgi:hypothetical protein